MNKHYKPSMFNYITHINNSMIIYNSYVGVKSICSIDKAKENKVEHWLKSNSLPVEEDNDFYQLIKLGYLVDENKNEKNVRNMMYAQYVCNNTLNLVIHTTKQCNFRCQYCYMTFENKSMSEDVQNRIVKFIEKNLHKYTEVKISWFGGEPLLEMDVIKSLSSRVINLCKRAKKTYSSSVTTNGYLLTPMNVETLINCNVDSYTITVDGIGKDHDNLRFLRGKQPTFYTIIENLDHISKKVRCPKLRVVIRCNITKKTAPHLLSYYDYFNKKYGDDRRFSLFIRPVRNAGGESIKVVEKDLLLDKEFDDILFSLSRNIKNGNLKLASNYMELEPSGYTCSAICQGKYTIGVEGDVSKCDAIDKRYIIGELNQKGDLISKGTNEEDWVTGCFEFNEKCENCFYSAVCFKGTCPIGRIDNCSNKCKLRTEEIDALICLYTNSNSIIRI